MLIVRPASPYRPFIRGFILIGMFLSYAAYPAWAAESTQSSDPSAPPTASAPPSSTAAPAQEEQRGSRMRQGMHAMQAACGADIKQFCSAVKPGGGRIVQCLEEHQKDVSSGCNQLLTKHESRKGKGN